MGSGFKDFTAGDVLTAAEVDGYLMRQSIMVFASTSARDTALSGNLEEGMHAYNTDNNEVWLYNGSTWICIHSPWTSFTPSFSGLGINNGDDDFEYRYVNGDLHVRGVLDFGSTTQITSNVSMTLPNSETARSTGGGSYGTALALDSGTGTFNGNTSIANGGTAVFPIFENGLMTATNPMTWTTNDELRIDLIVAL